jgi:transposase-like protein
MAKRTPIAPRRTQWTEADARRVLADWQRSGDTLEAFARSRGLVPQRLAWWRKRLHVGRREASTALTLVPATVIGDAPAASAAPATIIRLPHGIVIELEGASPGWIAALARELTRSAS